MEPFRSAPIVIPSPANLTSKQKRIVKAVAVVSLMLRGDVAGDAEAMAALYAEMRGVSADIILRCASALPLLSADLEQIFLHSDDVKPQLLAATSVRRAISVAASPGGRDIFGSSVLIDYQRARTATATAYFMAMDIEHVPWSTSSKAPGHVTIWTPETATLHYRMYPGTQKRFSPAYFTMSLGDMPNAQYGAMLSEFEAEHAAAAFSVSKGVFEPFIDR
eukprot:565513-Amphidinium_carterae.1